MRKTDEHNLYDILISCLSNQCNKAKELTESETAAAHPRAASCGVSRLKINGPETGLSVFWDTFHSKRSFALELVRLIF